MGAMVALAQPCTQTPARHHPPARSRARGGDSRNALWEFFGPDRKRAGGSLGVTPRNAQGLESAELRQRAGPYNPYRFTGRRLDGETGLSYFRARYIDHALGRFIGRDSHGYVDGMSLYGAYFIPGFRDPFGNYSWKECESYLDRAHEFEAMARDMDWRHDRALHGQPGVEEPHPEDALEYKQRAEYYRGSARIWRARWEACREGTLKPNAYGPSEDSSPGESGGDEGPGPIVDDDEVSEWLADRNQAGKTALCVVKRNLCIKWCGEWCGRQTGLKTCLDHCDHQYKECMMGRSTNWDHAGVRRACGYGGGDWGDLPTGEDIPEGATEFYEDLYKHRRYGKCHPEGPGL